MGMASVVLSMIDATVRNKDADEQRFARRP
jgi:hypothetical protein